MALDAFDCSASPLRLDSGELLYVTEVDAGAEYAAAIATTIECPQPRLFSI